MVNMKDGTHIDKIWILYTHGILQKKSRQNTEPMETTWSNPDYG